ncbi:CsbD family protein [Streptomyces sp. NPDC052236]
MSLAAKFIDKTQVVKGRIKEGCGRATGNLKQSGEKAKDAFKQ